MEPHEMTADQLLKECYRAHENAAQNREARRVQAIEKTASVVVPLLKARIFEIAKNGGYDATASVLKSDLGEFFDEDTFNAVVNRVREQLVGFAIYARILQMGSKTWFNIDISLPVK